MIAQGCTAAEDEGGQLQLWAAMQPDLSSSRQLRRFPTPLGLSSLSLTRLMEIFELIRLLSACHRTNKPTHIGVAALRIKGNKHKAALLEKEIQKLMKARTGQEWNEKSKLHYFKAPEDLCRTSVSPLIL